MHSLKRKRATRKFNVGANACAERDKKNLNHAGIKGRVSSGLHSTQITFNL